MSVCVGVLAYVSPCSAERPCAHLWEDELGQKRDEECCGYLGVRCRAGNAALSFAHRRTNPTAQL